jgi:hypothetical protein
MKFKILTDNLTNAQLQTNYHRLHKYLRAVYGMNIPTASGAPLFQGAALSKEAEASGNLVKMLMSSGILTNAVPWDAYIINTPRNAAITNTALQMLKGYGFKHTMNELLSRRNLTGTGQDTSLFYEAWRRMMKSGIEGPGVIDELKLPTFGINQTTIGQFDTGSWRQINKYKTAAFVIDLKQAESALEAGSLEQILGVDRLVVPGLNTDLYSRPHYVKGRIAENESFAYSLERALNLIRKAHETGRLEYLHRAKEHVAEYMSGVSKLSGDLMLGRSGKASDTGPFAGGRVKFKDYAREMKGHKTLGTLGRMVVGVSPEDYDDMIRETTRRLGKKRLARLNMNPASWFVGTVERQPITDVGPAIIYRDKELVKGQIALDESRRLLSKMDFDGDTMIARMLFREKSVKEMMNAIEGVTPAGKAYYQRWEYLKSISDAMDDLSEQAAVAGGYKDIYSAIGKRLEEHQPVFSFRTGELIADRGQLSAKALTSWIGRYSNLSDQLRFVGMGSGSLEDRLLRTDIAFMLKQTSIDFARKYKAGLNPGTLADEIEQTMTMAGAAGATGDKELIKAANEKLYSAFQHLGIESGIREAITRRRTTENLTKAQIEALDALEKRVPYLLQNWYSDLDPADVAKRAEVYKYTFAKYVPEGSPEEIMNYLHEVAEARHEAPGMGLPVGSSGARESRARLSAANRAKSMAAGSRHILRDLYTKLKGGEAGTVLAAGAIASIGLAALFGATTSPAPMDRPSGPFTMAPDRALVGIDGEAPIAGAGYGQAAERGSMASPLGYSSAPRPVIQRERRFYVDQANRVPALRMYSNEEPADASRYAMEVNNVMSAGYGGGSSINIVNDATNRRRTRLELADDAREDLIGRR